MTSDGPRRADILSVRCTGLKWATSRHLRKEQTPCANKETRLAFSRVQSLCRWQSRAISFFKAFLESYFLGAEPSFKEAL